MKKSIKLKSFGFSIILLLVSMLGNLGINNVSTDNIANYLNGDCYSVSNFIKDNFNAFVSEYNKNIETEEDYLYASSIEYQKDIINISDNSNAVYLDFNDNNGYCVVGNDYNFLDFSVFDDLTYLKEEETIYFSENDGFVYKTENGYAKYNMIYANQEYWGNINTTSRYYDGQSQNYGKGSGMINNPDAYIKDRYGNGFKLQTTKTLKNYSFVDQSHYNIYIDQNGHLEGNCTLSAMLGTMQYLRDNLGMINLPSSSININPINDTFYNKLTAKGFSSASNTVPTLYNTIRNEFIKYGYEYESTNKCSVYMQNIYRDVMKYYGYSNFPAQLILIWSFDSQVKKEIDLGYPTIWNTARGQYGAHSMVVIGYKRYYKQHKIWFIKWKEYKNLMILNDNWSTKETYFDLNAYGWDLFNEGFGTFLRVRGK